MNQKKFVLGAILAVALIASFFAQPKKVLRLGALKGPSGIALIHLFEAPPQLPGGLAFEAEAVGSADVMAAKIISGEYDLAVLPVNMAAKLRSAGIPILLAAVVGNGMVSFLTTDDNLDSIAELKGAEIFVAGQGATPDYLFRKVLISSGLDPSKDLRLSYALPYPETATALAAGKIRYAVLPEPFSTLALLANPSIKRPFDLSALWKTATGYDGYPMTIIAVSERATTEQLDAVKVVLAAVRASITAVKAEPSAAGVLVEKHNMGLKAAIAMKSIPKSEYVFIESAAARPAIEALLSVFMEMSPQSVGGKLPDDKFYARFGPF